MSEQPKDDVAREAYDLKRNDIEAALALAKKLRAEGRWSAATAEVVLQLQDDPFELLERL